MPPSFFLLPLLPPFPSPSPSCQEPALEATPSEHPTALAEPPALDRLGDTKLEASRDAFGLHTPGFYLLAVRWPTKVSGSAIPKFRRKIRTLEVQIPCVKTTNAE